MEKQELIDVLLEAQDHLFQAIEGLEFYCRETKDRNTEAYLLDHLKIMASEGHGYLSSDLNFDKVINNLRNSDDWFFGEGK